METIINLIFLTLITVMGFGTYKSVKNLNKSPRKAYLLDMVCGLIIGCLVGYLRSDIGFGLIIGVFIASLFVIGGIVSRWQVGKFTELEQKQTKKK